MVLKQCSIFTITKMKLGKGKKIQKFITKNQSWEDVGKKMINEIEKELGDG